MNPKSKTAVKQLLLLKRLGPKKEMRLAAEFPEKWQILISTILSAQTKDETTIAISEILYKKYNLINKLANAKLSEIKKIIRSINYYKTKAKHIKETAKIIVKNKGKIPNNIDKLLKFPGVGRKVANVYLVQAHKTQAIGVDTHCSQTAQSLGWSKNKNPYKIEKDLQKLFPKKYWNSINYIVVRFGRSHSKKEKLEIFRKLKKIK